MKKSNRALKEKRDDIGLMAMLIQTLSAKLGIATGMGDGRPYGWDTFRSAGGPGGRK